MTVSIDIDHTLCMSAQRCTYLYPNAFKLNDDGLAEVDDLSGMTEKDAENAEFECPNRAISVVRRTVSTGPGGA